LCFNLVIKCATVAKHLICLNAFKHRLDGLNAKQSLTNCLPFRKTWVTNTEECELNSICEAIMLIYLILCWPFRLPNTCFFFEETHPFCFFGLVFIAFFSFFDLLFYRSSFSPFFILVFFGSCSFISSLPQLTWD
jgi:hypothetical protein